MAKRKKKRSKTQPSKLFNAEYVTGAIAALIVLALSIYYCHDLFPSDSHNSLARFLLYGFLIAIAGISAFWYCAGSKNFPYYRYLVVGVFVGIGIYYIVSVSSVWYFGGDAGHYIVLAKSLATFQGFTVLNYIDAIPENLYGFGLPLLLVPVY